MIGKWKEDLEALVGKDLYCQFNDGMHYRGVIDRVLRDGDIGTWLHVRVHRHEFSEFFNPSEYGRLLEGGTALLVLDVSGVPDREARVLPHDGMWQVRR